MSQPFLGQLMCVGFTFNNRGWSNCDGQLLPIAQNQSLFSLFGTMYGGDGRTTFGLPELRGRTALHTGQGPGLPNFQQGSKGGQETVVLNQTEIPSHNHILVNGTNANQVSVRVTANENNANSSDIANSVLATALTYHAGPTDAPLGATSAVISGTTDLSGGNQDHENRQPYQVLRWLVALVGLFPSRN